jgi:hypothetical protein
MVLRLQKVKLRVHTPEAEGIDSEHRAHCRAEEKAALNANFGPGLTRVLQPDAVPAEGSL